jgi:YesN/AraC family two-component response regulator
MEKAQGLLRDTGLRVYDISQMVGYESPKYFSKVFKEVTGCTPKEYRDRQK